MFENSTLFIYFSLWNFKDLFSIKFNHTLQLFSPIFFFQSIALEDVCGALWWKCDCIETQIYIRTPSGEIRNVPTLWWKCSSIEAEICSQLLGGKSTWGNHYCILRYWIKHISVKNNSSYQQCSSIYNIYIYKKHRFIKGL